MTINDISPNLCQILNIKYNEKECLESDELEKMSKEAVDGLNTINGDTATVEITVRQLALLLRDWNKTTRVLKFEWPL